MHLFPAAVLAAGLMLATRCMSAEQARSSLDFEVCVFVCVCVCVPILCAVYTRV